MFRVKWEGFKLIDDSCDLSESSLLASGYAIEDLAGYPSKPKEEKGYQIRVCG